MNREILAEVQTLKLMKKTLLFYMSVQNVRCMKEKFDSTCLVGKAVLLVEAKSYVITRPISWSNVYFCQWHSISEEVKNIPGVT